MPYIKLDIPPILGYTATERAQAISKELLRISMPIAEQCASTYLFEWHTHPVTGACVLRADKNYVIWVHPQNNLTNLIALMPDLPEQVQAGLVQLIQNSQTITFGQLLTGTETTYNDDELIDLGF